MCRSLPFKLMFQLTICRRFGLSTEAHSAHCSSPTEFEWQRHPPSHKDGGGDPQAHGGCGDTFSRQEGQALPSWLMRFNYLYLEYPRASFVHLRYVDFANRCSVPWSYWPLHRCARRKASQATNFPSRRNPGKGAPHSSCPIARS